MNQSMQPAIQHLFQVSSIDDVAREQLEGMIEQYPCFGYGHYLLSRKLKAGDSDGFLAAAQRTSLYFPNPFWLHWMLEHAPDLGRRINEDGPGRRSFSESDSSRRMPDEGALAGQHSATPEYQSATPEYHSATPEYQSAEPEQQAPATVEPPEAWPEMVSPDPPADTSALQTDPQSPGGDSEYSSAVAQAPIQEDGESAADLLQNSIEKARELRESLQKINEDFVARTGHPIPAREPDPAIFADSEPGPFVEPQPEAFAEPHSTRDEPIRDEEAPFVLDEPEQAPMAMASATETSAEPVATSTGSATAIAGPSGQPAPFAAADTDTAPLFEPLHTIDYFASQGIRLVQEENPTDQLGRQLKSFTEWLRVMRRLPQREREIIPDRVAEQAVQDFAAHSIEGKEPVTETMAEVLAKQGMPERARIVYEKLSLLNPDKSAYFAARIEQLNSH